MRLSLAMMNKDFRSNVFWNERHSVRYLEVNFDGLDNGEILCLTLEISRLMQEEGEGKVRLVTDMSGMNKGTNVYSFGRKFSKAHQKYILKSAVVGIPHWLIPVYNVYVKFTKSKSQPFQFKDAGIDYVCS